MSLVGDRLALSFSRSCTLTCIRFARKPPLWAAEGLGWAVVRWFGLGWAGLGLLDGGRRGEDSSQSTDTAEAKE